MHAGGGQPLDAGHFKHGDTSFQVLDVQQQGQALKHYLSEAAANCISPGSEVTQASCICLHHLHAAAASSMTAGLLRVQEIDAAARLQHAQLHTVGHLIGNLVHQRWPGLLGCKGNHFPGGQASVVFKGSPMPDKALLASTLEADLAAAIAEGKQVGACRCLAVQCALGSSGHMLGGTNS